MATNEQYQTALYLCTVKISSPNTQQLNLTQWKYQNSFQSTNTGMLPLHDKYYIYPQPSPNATIYLYVAPSLKFYMNQKKEIQ